ncbi:MAG: hypothetical protein IT290_04195 [Deltaproteobacteria bacterium]|nr:hypothetical protein [Deltaproteobacteria bacterium]
MRRFTFGIVTTAAAASTLGDWAYAAVVPWIVAELGGSSLVLALLPAVGVGVSSLFNHSVLRAIRHLPPASGAILGNLVLALVMVVVAVAVGAAETKTLSPELVIGVLFLGRAALSLFGSPSELALATLTKQTMEIELQLLFVRIQDVSRYFCRALAGIASAALTTLALSTPVWFNAASFVLMAACILAIRPTAEFRGSEARSPRQTGGMFEKLAREIRLAFTDRATGGWILLQFTVDCSFCVFAFLPLIVTNLGGGEWEYGALLTVSGIGGIIGSSRPPQSRMILGVASIAAVLCAPIIGRMPTLLTAGVCYFLGMIALTACDGFVKQRMQLLPYDDHGEAARFTHRWLTSLSMVTYIVPGAFLSMGYSLATVYAAWSTLWMIVLLIVWYRYFGKKAL